MTTDGTPATVSRRYAARPGGRPAHDGHVHAVGPGPHRSAQPGRAEGEGAGEPLGQRGFVAVVEQLLQLGRAPADPGRPRSTPVPARPARRSRRSQAADDLGQQGAHPRGGSGAGGEHVGVVRARSSDRPAARLVTSESASTSAPSARAAIASYTVDMPTRSAPRVCSARISAGRLELRARACTRRRPPRAPGRRCGRSRAAAGCSTR